ncbi:hypothetical protein EV643_13743 [Kribbella sp. VKM Ac-2527]|uniref:Uncharacterized protein n=1 Tax=Kribbella caucasensis TaxID=2512215 RepID=A0A4R6J8A4_9ACTN|nr:hypothetical protein EV643_13743 [Kribbella sp. VKM Ac-2527]
MAVRARPRAVAEAAVMKETWDGWAVRTAAVSQLAVAGRRRRASIGCSGSVWSAVGWSAVGWSAVGWSAVGWSAVGWSAVGWSAVGGSGVGWSGAGLWRSDADMGFEGVELLLAYAGDLLELVDGGEGAVLGAVVEDSLG